MKKVVFAAAFAVVSTGAYAGSMDAPIMEPEVIVEDTTSSAGDDFVIPMMLLLIAAAAAS